MKRIEITVAPNGSSRVETHGFTGSTCRQASRFLEQTLGTPQQSQLKREYFQAQAAETAPAQQTQ